MKRIQSQQAPKAIGSYSQGTQVGELIYTSGQLPIDPETGKIESVTINGQTKRCMETIQHILKDNGSNLQNIAKTTVYLANLADFKEFDNVYKGFFSEANYPSRTAFQVAALPLGALIEIEVVAKIESEEK